jgi:hypothetical protein
MSEITLYFIQRTYSRHSELFTLPYMVLMNGRIHDILKCRLFCQSLRQIFIMKNSLPHSHSNLYTGTVKFFFFPKYFIDSSYNNRKRFYQCITEVGKIYWQQVLICRLQSNSDLHPKISLSYIKQVTRFSKIDLIFSASSCWGLGKDDFFCASSLLNIARQDTYRVSCPSRYNCIHWMKRNWLGISLQLQTTTVIVIMHAKLFSVQRSRVKTERLFSINFCLNMHNYHFHQI